MSVTPSTLTIPQGGSQSCTVATAPVSGVPQILTMSISGLPAGVTATFAPAIVPVGQQSTLTLGVGVVPVGTYALTITATGSQSNHSTSLSLVVTASDFSL